mgnify:CR=1 FL=1
MKSSKSYLSPWIWITYGVLFVVAVPWYWTEGYGEILFGFPVWAVVSVGASALISCFTAWLFLFYWPEAGEEERSNQEEL